LTETALQTLLQQPDTTTTAGRRNQVFMILMYDSAARCSELTSLRVRDLRLDTTHPVVYLHGKGDKTRIVPLLAPRRGAVAHLAEERIAQHGHQGADPSDKRQTVRRPFDPHERVDLQSQRDQHGRQEHQAGAHVGQRVQRDETPSDPASA
jgi:site-specific recombinase XerC